MDLPPLKAVALRKVCCKSITLEVSHLETLELKAAALSNADCKVVTLDTIHLDTSCNILKREKTKSVVPFLKSKHH